MSGNIRSEKHLKDPEANWVLGQLDAVLGPIESKGQTASIIKLLSFLVTIEEIMARIQ